MELEVTRTQKYQAEVKVRNFRNAFGLKGKVGLQQNCLEIGAQLLCEAISKVREEGNASRVIILVHGKNQEKVQQLVEEAMKSTNSVEKPMLLLTAAWLEGLLPSSSITTMRPARLLLGIQMIMAQKFAEEPKGVVVVLENWSPAHVSEYLRSGCVDSYGAKGVQVVTIASTNRPKSFGGNFESKVLAGEDVKMAMVSQEMLAAVPPPPPGWKQLTCSVTTEQEPGKKEKKDRAEKVELTIHDDGSLPLCNNNGETERELDADHESMKIPVFDEVFGSVKYCYIGVIRVLLLLIPFAMFIYIMASY